MKAPSIGALSQRLRLQVRADQPDAGYQTQTFLTDVATVWGRIDPVGGGLYVGSRQIGAGITHRIFLRYRSDITADTVIRCRGRTFRPVRVTDIDRRFTVVEANEEGADAL